jgi:opacity protein-like surface antigen
MCRKEFVMQRVWTAVGVAFALVVAAPVGAQAQTFLTPYIGATFAEDAPTEKLSTGVSLTFMGAVAGFELDVGYTPDFFDQEDDVALVADSNVTTIMGNLLIGVGAGPVRPYGAIGIGLLRSRLDFDDLFDDVDTNDWGMNVGFGVIGMVSERVGLRGDVRYFRSLEDPEVGDDDFDVALGNFDFWRATGGVTFRF